MDNLLLTGGCGFIGTNFVHYLLENTSFSGRIINVDCLTYAGNPANLVEIREAFPDRYAFSQTDICDAKALAEVFDQFDIDSVCHFAAESHVDRSIVGPGAFIQTNIVGTFNLLEAARERMDRVTLFHHISTDEVFGSLGDTGLFSEETPYNPSSPYSASKAGSDHLVRAYHHTYGLPVTVSNCSNNYGPYQFPEKLIPLMILNALEGKSLPVYGEGKNVRDWLYVRDHCVAVYEIMKRGEKGVTYNIGGKNEWQNIDVVNLIADELDELTGPLPSGPRRELITFVADRPGHDLRYAMDSSRLEQDLGWQPAETFETGLRQTIQWYLDHPDWVEQVRSGTYREWMETNYANRNA